MEGRKVAPDDVPESLRSLHGVELKRRSTPYGANQMICSTFFLLGNFPVGLFGATATHNAHYRSMLLDLFYQAAGVSNN